MLRLAHRHGLIQLTIYSPEQFVYALCSYCECCGHDIEFMQKLNRPDLVAHADYIAVVDTDACIQFGVCFERCVFGARGGEPGGWSFSRIKAMDAVSVSQPVSQMQSRCNSGRADEISSCSQTFFLEDLIVHQESLAEG